MRPPIAPARRDPDGRAGRRGHGIDCARRNGGLNYPCSYGQYILLERLGIGGMSEVDLARQKMGDRDFVRFVVIKRIKADRSGDAAFIRMFKDEARITSELHHECIGQVYDFGRHGDEYYLALEYVPGIDVRAMINALRERQQRVPIRVALRILCDVLDGLEYAHKKRDAFGRPMNIVHRDVNPRNIMVSIHGETKLIDFGVAKAAGRLEHTKTDHVKGKFSYMAPEQITGESVDHRADLFAVGLTLHEFIAGYGPFFGLNQVQIVHRLLHAQMPEMPPVRDIPDDTQLRRAHDKALAANPAERYASAAEFKRDLETIANQVGGLPSREQLARFLQKIDPQLTDRLQSKMAAYAGDIDVTTTAGEPRPVGIEPAEEISGTMDTAAGAPRLPRTADVTRPSTTSWPATSEHTSTQLTQTGRTVVVGVAAGAFSFMGLVIVALVGALVGVLWWAPWTPEAVTEIEPATPIPMPVAEPAPVPVPVPSPAPAPDPEPVAPQPVKPQPVKPQPVKPQPVKPAPEPAPAPEPVPEPEPVPVPVPAPVVVAPEPAPVPQPAGPDPSTFGTLKVTSAEKGRAVKVNGATVGVTPYVAKMAPGSYEVSVEGYSTRTIRVNPKQDAPAIFQ